MLNKPQVNYKKEEEAEVGEWEEMKVSNQYRKNLKRKWKNHSNKQREINWSTVSKIQIRMIKKLVKLPVSKLN